jgi:NADPH:quinone reductase-like Zn-dependent oxidoreductase
MRALVFKRYGRADQIAFADIPRPTLKLDGILVLVHAAGLNSIDKMIPKGTFTAVFMRVQPRNVRFAAADAQ